MNRMHLRLLLALPLLAIAMASTAAEPAPGRYAAERGAGELAISRAKTGLRFAIEALGANGHSCSLDGAIAGGVGITEDGGSGICRVAFRPVRGGYDVQALTVDACRDWCGMRAGFENTYRTLPPQCEDTRYDARRADFLRLYRARRYADALASATALRDACGRFRWFVDADALANDIAITQYHLGRPRQCLATLRGTFAWDYDADDDASGTWLPPADAESYAPVAKSTATNRRLCEAALKPKH